MSPESIWHLSSRGICRRAETLTSNLNRCMSQPTLQELWAAHQSGPAPDFSGLEVAGVEVAALVAQVIVCVEQAAAMPGPLDYARTGLLRHAYAQLWAVDDAIPLAAQDWIDRLRAMTRLILEQATLDLL